VTLCPYAITISGHIWLGREERLFAFLCKRRRYHNFPFSLPLVLSLACTTVLLNAKDKKECNAEKGYQSKFLLTSLGTELAVCVSGVFFQGKEKLSTY